MLLAVKEARKNLKSLHGGLPRPGGGPFGDCIIKGKKVLAVARNTVLKNKDATCHAEISAIRIASKKLKTHELKGCEIYSTTEPCPMCFSAIHWAKIDKIYFGTRTSDVKKYFNELTITDATLKRLGKSKVKIVPNVAWEECNELLKDWGKIKKRPKY
jgi:tRNA(Arg) A34 adenosine deaminase TadA